MLSLLIDHWPMQPQTLIYSKDNDVSPGPCWVFRTNMARIYRSDMRKYVRLHMPGPTAQFIIMCALLCNPYQYP
jgi:hypothetical protein